jgi:excinuclease ABC subunit A
MSNDNIIVHNASENNLRSISLAFPKNKLIAVTGVSGSGKSSLAFDVLYREAEIRYLGSLSSHARQFLGKIRRPHVDKVEGISPAIAVDQRPVVANVRSTVGTITGIYDHLRLLFARLGRTANKEPEFKIERSLFSFNAPAGACPSCRGLGVEDRLDPDLLVADAGKSLRQGCMAITAPNGYIIYTQVTMDVLDKVCRAEGFSADTPWKDLTPAQKHIVLYGSEKIAIPYGKHTLASRMRWSGITAKPRETGFYKGILPVMDTILRHKRNKNILRFVRTSACSSCHGTRLNTNALSVKIRGYDIAALASLQLDQLQKALEELPFSDREIPVAAPIIGQISKRIGLMRRLGLSYLSLSRESTTLSAGEAQRMRLGVQAGTGLSGILYIFDEPSVGLHPSDTHRLIEVLEDLRDQGNTVLVVEHEEEFLRRADWWIDIGPEAGIDGGRVLHNIDTSEMDQIPTDQFRQSRTLSFLRGIEQIDMPVSRRKPRSMLSIHGAEENNLKNIDVDFSLEALNVVTGVSGAGKSSLALNVLGNFLRHRLHSSSDKPGTCHDIQGWEGITKVIPIDQSPIGRTPRSNPATYTGLFDFIRSLFAALPESKEKGWNKGRFSFNTSGGRCETCQGAGYVQIGMHFMGDVEVLCEECDGKRFHADTLEIHFRGHNIYDVLELSVAEAIALFAADPRILRYLKTMADLGLGYIKLGQRSSTLSGGEAQRIKLATELARPQAAHTLYILDEPTTGLHQADVGHLLKALQALVEQKNTVIVIEHHLGLIAAADWVVDLGPGSGREGGRLLAQGTPETILDCQESQTGRALREYLENRSARAISKAALPQASRRTKGETVPKVMRITGISTHNLQNIDIAIPRNQITVITGVSGSGKSSLAFDTIHAEGQNRFLASFSTYARTQIGSRLSATFERASGLTPTLAVDQHGVSANSRSTVGTMTGIYDWYRLLFSRVAISDTREPPALSSLFSFNHQTGACPRCTGLGQITVCDPEMLITNPEKSILAGAMDGTKTGRFYGDPFGQYIATLRTVGQTHGIDFSVPWDQLSQTGRDLALHGTGKESHEVIWKYRRGDRAGEHHFHGRWIGLTGLVGKEYDRKHADARGQKLLPLMKQDLCPACNGSRLKPEALAFTIGGTNIAGLSSLPVSLALEFLADTDGALKDPSHALIAAPIVKEIVCRLEFLVELGLSYLTLARNASSLSGGEAQRVKLAAQLSSGLTNITYVLDEPTVGLHPVDTGRLMATLRTLQHAGNTVIMVEHDRDVICAADRILDLGPGAGVQGGKIVADGSPEDIKHNPLSVTGRYLSIQPRMPEVRNKALQPGLRIENAYANNLKHFALDVPAGGVIAVTGVSGSGKSSLVYDLIHQSWARGKACGCSSITGFGNFHRVIAIRQKSHFSSTQGTPATFTGMLDRIRDLFAATEDARRGNLKKKHFSFAEKSGRCESCQGLGRTRVSMDFLSDVYVLCEQCKGRRYREEVLACRYQGKNIAEVLALTANEAAGFFGEQKALAAQLQMLGRVGLGYLQLGQPLDSLSGGEAQRLMLAAELAQTARGKILYLFDEPATGLHFSDIEHLLRLFQLLADQGHTLYMIEHDVQVISQADWVIDLGPGGGDQGGNVIAGGRLSEIVRNEDSATGRYLKAHFNL